MNVGDLMEKLWVQRGFHDAGNRLDWRRQEQLDALNQVQDDLTEHTTLLYHLLDEWTLTLVAGTAVYRLNDWCRRVTEIRDSDGAPIPLISPRRADEEQWRASTLVSNTPYVVTRYPSTKDALLSGAAASAVEAATSITALAGLSDTHIGMMIRLNGEANDYKIVSQTVTACVVDRPVHARLTGNSTQATAAGWTGAGYTAVRWEVSPIGRLRIEFLPAPTAAATVYYRGLRAPRRLVNMNETPELQDAHHGLLWMGSLALCSGFDAKDPDYQRFKMEYAAALAKYKARDEDELWASCADRPQVLSLYGNAPNRNLPSQYFRNARYPNP